MVRRRKTAIFFLILGICLSALAVALNVGWILLNLREVALLVFGIIFFALIITGLILNTVFLVKEIRRNERHDAFLNAVTHELKTPIASIRLYLDTLKERDLSPEQRSEFYERMSQDNDRLLNTVEQVLIAGRSGVKHDPATMKEVDAADIIRAASEIVERRYGLNAGQIELHLDDSIRFFGDIDDLSTVFKNLLDNAVKYSQPKPNVSVMMTSLGTGKADVTITDNGMGISPSELKRIFKRFYRTSTVVERRVKGTGLGLAIVQEIVKRHGGTVTAESSGEGKGTTFRVRLPQL